LHKRRPGFPIVTEKQTVEQFLDWWLTQCVKPSVRVRTFNSYGEQVRLHLTPAFGPIELTKLNAQQAQEFFNSQLETLSLRSVHYQRRVLRIALQKAFDLCLVTQNIADKVELKAIPKNNNVQVLEPEAARKYIKAAKVNRLSAFFMLAVVTGMRHSELIGLRWKDIDFEARELYVRQQLQRINHEWHVSEPKSETSRRCVELADELISLLRAHRSRQLKERLKAGDKWQERGLVFTRSNGEPLHQKFTGSVHKAILKSAGLPACRIHDLRHSAASLLLAQGVPLKVVSDILGHSQIAITADLYSHVIPQARRDATEKLASVLLRGEAKSR